MACFQSLSFSHAAFPSVPVEATDFEEAKLWRMYEDALGLVLRLPVRSPRGRDETFWTGVWDDSMKVQEAQGRTEA